MSLKYFVLEGADVGRSKSKRLAVKESEEIEIAESHWADRRHAEIDEKAKTMMRAYLSRSEVME
jgi:hypothetical protein